MKHRYNHKTGKTKSDEAMIVRILFFQTLICIQISQKNRDLKIRAKLKEHALGFSSFDGFPRTLLREENAVFALLFCR